MRLADADGAPPPGSAAAEEAIAWMVRLGDADADGALREACQRWQHARPENAAAWRRLTGLGSRLGTLPAPAALAALAAAPATLRRRRALIIGAPIGFGLVTALGTLAAPVAQARLADLRTSVGERLTHRLPDGSRLALNTDTAVNVAFGNGERHVRLLRGEIALWPVDAGDAPLRVSTAGGDVRSRQGYLRLLHQGDATSVAVFEGRAELRPARGAPAWLAAGEATRLDRAGSAPARPADADRLAWQDGQLVARNRRLGDFMADLARYRHGYLGVASEIADARLSGVFPLADTDRVLAAVARLLDVRVVYRTRYWARLVPA